MIEKAQGEFDVGNLGTEDVLEARVITGDDLFNTSGETIVTEEIVVVKKLLGPLTSKDVPILRCVGLNYATHSKSHNMQSYPA